MSRNVAKCREMSKNFEFCRILSNFVDVAVRGGPFKESRDFCHLDQLEVGPGFSSTSFRTLGRHFFCDLVFEK